MRRLTGVALAVALVAGACGGDDADSAPDAAPAVDTPAAVGDEPAISAVPEADGSETTAENRQADPDAEEVLEPVEPENSGDEISGPVVPEQVIRFATPDGEDLSGTVFGAGEIGIVLAHMRGRDQSTWADFARRAAADGYQVLTFDFRGYGGSSGERDTDLDVDLLAAVNTLAERGPNRVAVMGASMGATATVNLAARYDVAAAVSLSAPANFLGLDAAGVASDVAEPLLVVVAEGDQPYAAAATVIADAAPNAVLEVFDGNAHGTNLFGDHEIALTGLLLDFVRTRVG